MELKIPVTVEYTNVVVKICKGHPTCEGCPFWKKHKGCYFREKTPREWKFPEEFEDVKATNIEDTNEYLIGYKIGYDIAQCNAQATKEEWGKAEYDRGFEDGKNEVFHNAELIPELKKIEYTKGYNEALEDVSNLIAFYDFHFMEEYYPEELGKGYTLCNLNDKYGLAEVLKNWKTYTKQKKEVENYHKLVDTLRTVTDEYPRETIVSALSEFGIEVNESEDVNENRCV